MLSLIALQALRPLFPSLGRVSSNLCTAFCQDSATVLVTGRQCHCPQTVWPPLSLHDGANRRHCAPRLMDFSAQWRILLNEELYDMYCLPNKTELHLSGLIGKASHLDMQKIRIIGNFLSK